MKFFSFTTNPEPPPRPPSSWIEENRLPETRGELMAVSISQGELGELLWRIICKQRDLEDRIWKLLDLIKETK